MDERRLFDFLEELIELQERHDIKLTSFQWADYAPVKADIRAKVISIEKQIRFKLSEEYGEAN